MKKRLFFSLLVLLSVFSVRAYDFEVDGIYYSVISGTTEVAVIYNYPGYSGTVVIPATVVQDGITYRVTTIARGALSSGGRLASVTIPESIVCMEDAFCECSSLTSIEWNAKRCADLKPFYKRPELNVSLTSITFGNQVEYIPSLLFCFCGGLTSVTIPNGVSTIGSWVFSDCSGLTSVTIPESVDTIGAGAFSGTAISSPLYNSKVFAYMPKDYSGEYKIPSGIQSICSYAFDSCIGLSSCVIPESITSIGDAFRSCRNLAIEWNAKNCQYHPSYTGWSTEGPFYECALSSITFSSQVTCIPAYLCYGCELASVVIPKGVSSVGAYAFSYCGNLTSVTLPEGVTSVGAYAFSYCRNLTSVTLPEGVTSVGAYAFSYCRNLTSVFIPESVASIGADAFSGTAISSPLYNSRIFAYMPGDYSGEYSIPSGIQLIETTAFKNCKGLVSVMMPESVNAIGYNAFYGCSDLRLVTSLAKEPPVCDSVVFSDYYGTLYVPRGCKAAYQLEPEWYKFSKIEELSSAGIATVTVRANDSSMGIVIGGGEYNLDEQITLAAIPNPGYYFVKWDDGKTANPRILTVAENLTLTAIFARNNDTPPTANEEVLSAAPFAYVQGRTAYLSDGLGEVEAFTATGQRVYRGFDRSITLPRPGVYILRVVADGCRCKIIVR